MAASLFDRFWPESWEPRTAEQTPAVMTPKRELTQDEWERLVWWDWVLEGLDETIRRRKARAIHTRSS